MLDSQSRKQYSKIKYKIKNKQDSKIRIRAGKVGKAFLVKIKSKDLGVFFNRLCSAATGK